MIDIVFNHTSYDSVLIKEHPDNENCPPFIAFIDDHGKHDDGAA